MPSLLLLNGSPRGERSNSMQMLLRVAEGWEEAGGGAPETLHLARKVDFARAVETFAQADVVLLGMPLYTDAMPALVMGFIEALAPYATPSAGATCGGANVSECMVKRPTLAFLVQSGFPEALHARPLARYLEKLARRLGAPCAGVMVRGGGEALQVMPEEANRKLWAQLRTLGGQLAREGRFGAEGLRALAGTERYSWLSAMLLSVACKLPLTHFYWNGQLKKNGVWERRFDAPYGPAYRP